MTRHLTIVLLLFTLPTFGQNKHCRCDKDTLMNGATVSCETTTLSNNSKLYWQYNCDKIWLTLENVKGQKSVIDEVPIELYAYTYRLGFHLIREFNTSLIFRNGCPANGPCIYTLVDKTTGEKVREFGQLICIDTDIRDDTKYLFDFVVYADPNYKDLVIEFIDTKKKLVIPFDFQKNNLTAIVPEFQFEKMKLNGSVLTLFYNRTDNNERNFQINLDSEKYSR